MSRDTAPGRVATQLISCSPTPMYQSRRDHLSEPKLAATASSHLDRPLWAAVGSSSGLSLFLGGGNIVNDVAVVESPAAVAANTDANTNTGAPDTAPATVDSALSKEGEGEGGSSGAPQTLKTPTPAPETPAPTEVDAPGLSTVSTVPA
ncbi:hypothetical protein B0H14DRAFT_3463110 [Mycena olivaceomarginata]|nr:hypothetical protein B0H14DRAFT_3463110 [Mycena olivaceomarginata]